MPKIKTVKNSDVMYRHWTSHRTKAVLILVHGLGIQSKDWNVIAGFLSKKGFSSYAIELKGFGETKGIRAYIDSFDTYHQDVKTLFDEIRKEHPKKKIFILGQSMGGLIAFATAERYPDLFSGVIVISPAFKSALKFSPAEYFKFVTSFIFNPKEKFKLGFDTTMITRNKKYQKYLDADKKRVRFDTGKFVENILFEEIWAERHLKSIKVPILFLLAGKDYLVDLEESIKVFDKLSAKDKSLIQYPEMFHCLSIDLGKEHVFNDILSWLTERV